MAKAKAKKPRKSVKKATKLCPKPRKKSVRKGRVTLDQTPLDKIITLI